MENQVIIDILDSLSKQLNCFFVYDSSILNYEHEYSINRNGVLLVDALNELFVNENFIYTEIKKQIIIGKSRVLEKENFLFLNGFVYDYDSKDKLGFASLSLKGKYIGTSANADGKYNIKIKKENINDTLVFSYLSYSNYYLPIKDITQKQNDIFLKSKTISLQEIYIRNTKPELLIIAALKKVNENYMSKDASLEVFYRESVTKGNKYMIYLESFMNIYKPSYLKKNASEIVNLIQARKIYDVRRIDTTSLRLKGGVAACLKLDFIKTGVSFLEREMFKFYRYNLVNIDIINNRTVYVISANAINENNISLISATIYIDTQDLAFRKLELFYPPKALRKFKNKMILKKSNKLKVRTLAVSYSISYKKVDGKYYMSKCLGSLKFRVKHKHKLFSNLFNVNFEMLLTNIDTNKVSMHINKKLRLKTNSFMSKQAYKYDINFWGNKTIIEPEKNILDAIANVKSMVKQEK